MNFVETTAAEVLALRVQEMPGEELAELSGRLAVTDGRAHNFPGDLPAGDASAFPWRMIVEAVAACPGDLAAAAEWVGLGLTASGLEVQKLNADERPLAVAAASELRRRADAARPDLAALRRGELVSGKWEPFPLAELPAGLRGYVRTQSEAVGVDPAAIALPCLVALAGAVGTSRIVELKGGYTMPLSLWGALVADSGSRKSPALNAAIWPVRQRQAEKFAEWRGMVAEWERENPKARGERPKADRVICGDVTPERCAALLAENGRGLILWRDELTGFLDINRYGQGSGGGASAFWLGVYDGRLDPVDRQSGDPVFSERAALSVCGSIQPGIFKRDLSGVATESGLLARFILAMPPELPRRWTDAEPPASAIEYYAGLFRALFGLRTEDGEPVTMTLDAGAREHWGAEYEAFGRFFSTKDDRLRAHFAKLDGVAGRLAGLLELIEQQTRPVVSAESVRRAWALVRWFAQEAGRVYGVAFGGDSEDMGRKIVEYVRRRPGCAPSALSGGGVWRLHKQTRDELLADLIEAGLVTSRGKGLYVLQVEGAGLN